MKYTTTNLRFDARHWWAMHEPAIRNFAWGGVFVTMLLLIHRLLNPIAPPQPTVIREQLRPVIMIQTAAPLPTLPPVPTMTPWPTAEPVVIEIPAPAPPPQVIYVQVESPPTPEPMVEPPPTLAPEQAAILDRQAWAEQAQQHTGGSGKMPAIDVGTIPTQGVAQATTDYLWCAGIAKSGAGRCVGR